jgi:ABC-type ATPase involved in cell division
VNENLKMSAALLSRFDLIFILLDKPDELLDKRVSEHIMSVSFTVFLLCVGVRFCTHDVHILFMVDGNDMFASHLDAF